MNVRIKRLHKDAVIPRYAKPGDSGFDLVAVEDVIIAPGETQLVPTGLAFEIPEGYELLVRPRSGVSLRTKLRVANPPGTIDAGFRGEVKVIIDNIAQPRYLFSIGCAQTTQEYATLDNEKVPTEIVDTYVYTYGNNDHTEKVPLKVPVGTYLIRKGDRIAQGVIAPVIRATFEETDGDLTETERGAGGFGSTGTSTEVSANDRN
jgi:dUTP pyrophosphatase